MYYCERCHLLNQHDVCFQCHRRKLRKVREDDYCFLEMIDALYANMLEEMLERYHIARILKPVIGAGITSSIGIRTEKYEVYVLYKDYQKASMIIQERFQQS